MAKKNEPDLGGMEIIVRDNNAVALPTKDTAELWLKDKLAGDTPELYHKLKASIDKHLEGSVDKDGNVKLPSARIMELVARILGMDAGANGPLVVQNFNTQNNIKSTGTLEDLIRRSEQRKNESTVIDAEIIGE